LLLLLLLKLLSLLQFLLTVMLCQLQLLQPLLQPLLPWHPAQLLLESLKEFLCLLVSFQQLLVPNAGLCAAYLGWGRQLMPLHSAIDC
jgi:hypothetical protein